MKSSSSAHLNRRAFLQFSASAGLLFPFSSGLAQQTQVIAETQFGKVRGSESLGIKVFKGIPYGADTGGSNRFMPPKDPQPWTDIRDTLSYGPAAPQSDPASGRQQDGHESEDCLVLNIWSRGLNDGAKRPVLFWCHGGGFRTLSGSSPRYDGTNLALRGDVVVVTINHRLNMMGFSHFADLGGADFALSGTVGMLDMVHALRWTKNNIERFGGDPDRVMIFGESGGGRKVATLLAMPSAKGLFHSAIIQSGATLRLPARDQATALAQRLLDTLNINKNNLGRLQELPISEIMNAYVRVNRQINPDEYGGGFSPVMDGDVLPYHPFSPVASPVNPDVPLIVGANRTEMTFFSEAAAFELDEQGMRAQIAGIVGADHVDNVIEVYRQANPDASPAALAFLVSSDSRYVMASITIAERRAALNAGPTYLYYLTWETPADGGRLMSPHTLDIPFIFDNVTSNPLTAGSQTAIALADKVSDSVINFARSGSPNVGKLPHWMPYNSSDRATMVLNDSSQLINDPIGSARQTMQAILKL